MSSDFNRNKIEKAFEWLLWNSRLFVLIAVVCTLLGAIGLFILGSVEIVNTLMNIFGNYAQGDSAKTLIGIIGAIDLYLMGIIMLIFSFGIYELFVSKIDIARLHSDMKLLDIGSLDELKNKILKVVVMVLIVTFFKEMLVMKFNTPLEMLFFAMSIVGVAWAVYLIRKYEEE